MEFTILNSIDEKLNEALAYKTKLNSIYKVLESFINQEVAITSKSFKKFSFAIKTKPPKVKTSSILSETLSIYIETELERINSRIKFHENLKKDVLSQYFDFINKFPNLNKPRQKLTSLANQIKMIKAKQSSLSSKDPGNMMPMETQKIGEINENKNLTFEPSEQSIGKVTLTQLAEELEMVQIEFVSESKKFKKLLSDLIIEEKKVLAFISKCLYLEIEYHAYCSQLLKSALDNIRSKIMVNKIVFGVDIEIHCKAENVSIATVINDCICYLLSYGITEPGLFRVNASAIKVKKLISLIDSGFTVTLNHIDNVHIVANLLKRYLMSLPNPLIPFDLFDEFKRCNELANQKVKLEEMINLMNKIPSYNLENLKYLIKFLYIVCENASANEMDEGSLGIIFGPCILRKNHLADQNSDMTFCNSDVVIYFLKNFDELIGKGVILNDTFYKIFSFETDELIVSDGRNSSTLEKDKSSKQESEKYEANIPNSGKESSNDNL